MQMAQDVQAIQHLDDSCRNPKMTVVSTIQCNHEKHSDLQNIKQALMNRPTVAKINQAIVIKLP